MRLECTNCHDLWVLDEDNAGTECPKPRCEGFLRKIAPIRPNLVGDPYVDPQASWHYRQLILYQAAIKHKRELASAGAGTTWEEMWFYGR